MLKPIVSKDIKSHMNRENIVYTLVQKEKYTEPSIKLHNSQMCMCEDGAKPSSK